MWVSLQDSPAGPAVVDVIVVGPDGVVLANGSVALQSATALAALLQLAAAHDFEVGHERLSGFGGCHGHYVRSIAGYTETSTGGWNYYTRQPGGAWEWQPAGAGCALPLGVQVEWCWVEHDVCEHHAP